jgi:hypothetical protein
MCNIQRLSHAHFDSIIWTLSSTGMFSTKTTHHLITSSPPRSPLPNLNCKLKFNHRLKLFLWKMVWNIIPTKVRISESIPNFNSDTNCSLCSYPTDSLYHLFFTYPIARLSGLASIFLAFGQILLL